MICGHGTQLTDPPENPSRLIKMTTYIAMLCALAVIVALPMLARKIMRMLKKVRRLFASPLQEIIAPEIINDAFYEAIYKLGSSEEVKTILEIGSSSGVGSTQAFVKGIRVNPLHSTLFCMELSKERFALLARALC